MIFYYNLLKEIIFFIKLVLNSQKIIVQILAHFLTSIEIEALNWTLTGSSLTSSKEVLQAA